MEPSPSRTAMLAAVARGLHRLKDPFPWVLDDPFATVLVGPGWDQLVALADTLFREGLQREVRAWTTVRSRYTEDRLIGGDFTQYVVLGAGLDSFAWRRPDLLRTVTMLRSTIRRRRRGNGSGSRRWACR